MSQDQAQLPRGGPHSSSGAGADRKAAADLQGRCTGARGARAAASYHFSLLASIENLFGLSHSGYAGSQGLLVFDTSVYNAHK
jgi:phosphatidylinositol-3-phosphatase